MSLLGRGSSNGVDAEVRFNPSRETKSDSEELRRKLEIPDHTFVIGFVGRIVKDKGVEELIQAWQTIRDRFDCFLLIIGHTEAQNPVSAVTLEILEKDPRIVTAPVVENKRMPSHYNLMDLLVLPSYREGFPNVVLEAAAMEVPTVATTVTGCVDAVKDRETGALVPPRNSLALAQALETYLENDDLLSKHGRAARERVLRDFQQVAIWEALYNEYMLLLSQKGLAHATAGQLDSAGISGVGGSRCRGN